MFLLALTILVVQGVLRPNIFVAFLGGIPVAAIGYKDDCHHVTPRARALIHVTAAIWALIWLGGMPPLNLGFFVLFWGWFGQIVGVLGIVWMINLYNFMDGIDGISASEAVYVGLVSGSLLFLSSAAGLGWVAWFLGAACLGFLYWNWPPAKIFMGDVGSGFVGFCFAVLVIASANTYAVDFIPWLILLSIFIVDATLTLLRRAAHGACWYEAHHSHAYQHAATRFDSHLKVTLGIIVIDWTWLSIWAFIAWRWPELSVFAAVIAILPLVSIAFRFEAGVTTTATTK